MVVQERFQVHSQHVLFVMMMEFGFFVSYAYSIPCYSLCGSMSGIGVQFAY